MRIRAIKPEFWTSGPLSSLDLELIHDGELRNRINEMAPMSSTCEYLYMLFDESDGLIYIGRSFRPADRLTKHRSKPWWGLVSGLAIVRVMEPPRHDWLPWAKSGPNTSLVEAFAIRELNPPHNVARPKVVI